jgi:cell division protein FtsL
VKQQVEKSDFATVVTLVSAAAIVVASLLLLVWVRTAQIKVGYRVHELESEMLKLKQERAALEVERASLLRPARLAELSRTTLGLVAVDAAHVIDVSSLSAMGGGAK